MAAKVAPKNVGEAINGRELFAVNPQMTLTQALSLMLNKGIHRTPVVVEDNKLVGILSLSDLRVAVDSPLHHAPDMYKHFDQTSVEKAMRRHVETVEPDESLVNVAKLLRVSSLNALVVVEKGTKDKVVGVISRTDILDDYIRHLEPLQK